MYSFTGPQDDTKAGPLPRRPLHRTPPSISRACRQMHRPPESDCPRRSSLQGTPETTSPDRDRSPQQSASSDPSANRVGIIQRESNNQVRFHTWGNSGFSDTQARGISSRVNEARLTGFAVMESCNGALCWTGREAIAIFIKSHAPHVVRVG